MRRLRATTNERGATAVTVALLLVALMGFGALAVDVGSTWWDVKELQNGADAGALAIAQRCAKDGEGGECQTGYKGDGGTSSGFAKGNKVSDSKVDGWVSDLNMTEGWVEVTTQSESQLWLARMLDGVSSTPETRTARASWGAPSKALTLPVATSTCWFQYQTGSTATVPPPTDKQFFIPLVSKSNAIADGGMTCGTQAAHNETAGGFGWLLPDSPGSCTLTVDLSNPWKAVSTGQPPSCEIAKVLKVGDTVLMPLFDQWKGSGSNAKYHIYAFAAVKVNSYCFGPHDSSPVTWSDCQKLPVKTDWGPNLGVTFVTYVSLQDALAWGGPNLGAQTVRLTK